MLPKVDGITVCQRIREHSNVPIIMLTAKGEQIDKILGLEIRRWLRLHDQALQYPGGQGPHQDHPAPRRRVHAQNDVRRTAVRVHDMEINAINRSVTLGGKEVRADGQGV